MIFSNVDIKAEVRSFDFGEIYQISLGEKGRNRQLMVLTCPEEGTLIHKGLNPEYTVGLTKSGKPRINHDPGDEQLYLLLSSQGGYTRRGNGSIQVLREAKLDDYQVLAKGRGADGIAGRVGHWDAMLIKAPSEGIVRVRTGGAGYGTPSDLYLIHENRVYHCNPDSLQDCCDHLEIDLPCTILNADDCDSVLDGEEWALL